MSLSVLAINRHPGTVSGITVTGIAREDRIRLHRNWRPIHPCREHLIGNGILAVVECFIAGGPAENYSTAD
jgi:hypothetical protein